MPTTLRTAREIIDDANRDASKMAATGNDWATRHNRAYRAALSNGHYTHGLSAAVVRMIEGAALYADEHARRYDSRIGFDGVLGEAFSQVLQGVRTMLNGELGHLDAGTLDKMICQMASEHGINPDTWELWYTPSKGER